MAPSPNPSHPPLTIPARHQDAADPVSPRGSGSPVLATPRPSGLPSALATEPAWYLHRPRLDSVLERLQEPDARVLVLWDAAGSGKTAVMAGWARRLRAAHRTVAWFSATDLRDATDAAEIRRRLLVRGGETAGAGLPSPGRSGPGLRYVFVDDLHRAEMRPPTGPSNLTGLLEGLDSTPADTRLVISSRIRPGAGAAPLEAAGVLVELTDETLAFTLDETFELAAHDQVDLSADDGAALWRHTNGWATGLALALAWRQAEGAASDLSQFDGDNPVVGDYLAAEVVTGLDEGDRDVLLQSALSEVVTLDLAVAASERTDAGDVLDRLARSNTLIGRERAGHDGAGYRFHPILLAYLQGEGRRRDADAATARHLLASRWYSDRARGAAALEQALLAHDPDVTGDLIERFGLALSLTGAGDLVRRALAQLTGRPDTPATACLRVLLEPLSGAGRRRTQHLLEAANSAVQASFNTPGHDPASGLWAVVDEILHALHATERTELESRLRALQDGSAAQARQDIAVDLLAAMAQGRCLDRLGESGAAEDILSEVAATARNAGLDWLFLQASDLAATAAGNTGNWLHVAMLEGQMAATAAVPTRAARSTDEAPGRALLYAMIHRYDRCQPLDLDTLVDMAAPGSTDADPGVGVPAEVLLLLSHLDNAARSRQALDRLMLLMREAGAEHPRALSLCCVPLIELSGALDGRSETQQLARSIERALGENSLEVLLIRLLLAAPTRAGHPAEERLRAAALDERTAWRGATIVSAWIALAHVADVSGRHVESDARLLKALRFASRIGCERAFLAGGGQGAGLIRSRLGRLGDLDEFARHVLDCADGVHPHEGPHTPEHAQNSPALTPREREVLRELPFHQSVANIARKRNVSPNTVKTHLRNIYQKLEAANRADAVAIAQDHGLL